MAEEGVDDISVVGLLGVLQEVVGRDVGVRRVCCVLQAEACYYGAGHPLGEVHRVKVRVEGVTLLVSPAQSLLRIKELLARPVHNPHAVGEVGVSRYARGDGSEGLRQSGGYVCEASALRASGGKDGVLVYLVAALHEVNGAHTVKISVAVVVLAHVSPAVRIEVVAVFVIAAEHLSARREDKLAPLLVVVSTHRRGQGGRSAVGALIPYDGRISA